MISIDDAFITAAAPNADAVKNGRALALKKKFTELCISSDETLLFGYCQGSGKEPYLCSADFQFPTAAVYRCSCPSRQFPCKHSIGLLIAYAAGEKFTSAEIPATIAAKREKVAERVEKKKVEETKPRKVNKSALAKKFQAQIDGLEILERLAFDHMRQGLGNVTEAAADEVQTKISPQLATGYLPEAQVMLDRYAQLFTSAAGASRRSRKRKPDEEVSDDARFTLALEQLTKLGALARQGKAYLQSRIDDPEKLPDTESNIAMLTGQIWQLRELKELGLVETNVELMQLAFHTHDDAARKAFVDVGTWINLTSGKIQVTQNFRPYKAAKMIPADDSFARVAVVAELAVYPGTMNPRVRWEAYEARIVEPRDYQRIFELAASDFSAVVKEVKNHLRQPLTDHNPVFALKFARIGKIGEALIVEDAKQNRLLLTDESDLSESPSCELLSLLPPAALEGKVLVARFSYDIDAGLLTAKPLSIVTHDELIRLTV